MKDEIVTVHRLPPYIFEELETQVSLIDAGRLKTASMIILSPAGNEILIQSVGLKS